MFSSLWPRGPQPARLLCQWEVSRQECWSGLPYLRPGALAHPGIEPRSPALQTDSLPSEPPRKPMSTGVGSLCPLQGIFLIQGSSQGLSHCRPFFTNWATREAQIGSRFVWQIFSCLRTQCIIPHKVPYLRRIIKSNFIFDSLLVKQVTVLPVYKKQSVSKRILKKNSLQNCLKWNKIWRENLYKDFVELSN